MITDKGTCPECGLENVHMRSDGQVTHHIRDGVPMDDLKAACGFPVDGRESFRKMIVEMSASSPRPFYDAGPERVLPTPFKLTFDPSKEWTIDD